jgi:hypothetical protein
MSDDFIYPLFSSAAIGLSDSECIEPLGRIIEIIYTGKKASKHIAACSLLVMWFSFFLAQVFVPAKSRER